MRKVLLRMNEYMKYKVIKSLVDKIVIKKEQLYNFSALLELLTVLLINI